MEKYYKVIAVYLMVCVEKTHEEFLPLLIKRPSQRSRIDGHGNDYNHHNCCLMVNTLVFVVLNSFNNACTMEACLRGMLQSQFSGLCVFKACSFLNGCGFKG